MNVWDARFKKAADARLNDFNSSISVDHRMYAQDIKGSCAHAMMLAHEGIISLEDSLSIITGLTQIQKDIESGALAIDETAEDIHMFMESELTKRIQDAGKRLHTARSRNDQVALDTRMYALDETDKILTEIKQFINVLLDKAQENLDTIMDFDSVSLNSLDGVSDRDFCIEITSALAMLMMHLSRLSEEIILWCSWEFKFIELDDAFATGSSIMPQKKNPDVSELVRGKCGRVYGDLQTLLVMMKGLPLAYNKDMQEDKEALFDAIDTAHLCLTTMIPMLESAKVLKDNMRKAAAKGFINATDCADYLTKKGMPFRDAYRIIGALVSYAQDHDKTLETISLNEYQQFSELFKEDIYEAIALETCVQMRKVIGGPAPEIVEAHIQKVKEELGVIA